MKKQSFTYDGRQLEVKAVCANGVWSVRVFEKDHPANGAVYSVSEETAGEARASGLELVSDLMKTAQEDFIRWSDYLKNPALHDQEES